MFLASRGWPSGIKVLGVLIGGTLAAGSSNATNSILERNNDTKMNRTKLRPMAQMRLSLPLAWTAAIVAQVASFVIVTATCNLLAGLLTLLASAFYVFIYTLWLKPRTDQNIVIGGAAGALPCIIGYSAVTGTIVWQPIVLFLTVFMWTPPHFWALAIFHEQDYRRGGFPMMPITRGIRTTSKHILVYSILTVALSFSLLFDSQMRLIYSLFAAVLGAWFVAEAFFLYKDAEQLHRGRFMRFFHISNGYLAVLFIAIAIDALVK
jgi:protoheme IX farnesyltransferase